MRLLILLPFTPRLDATHGGARVITQFLTEITARHKVAILHFREADEPAADSFFHERCEIVEAVVRPASNRSLPARLWRYIHLLFSLLLLRPLWVSDWISPAFAKKARLLAHTFQPDIIQAEFHVMGQYLAALQDSAARRILVEYEPSGRAALYLQNLSPFLHRLVERIEKKSWRRYERRIYKRVDGIVAFTEADQKSIAATAGQTPIHIISPGIDIPAQPLSPLGTPPLSLLFVGNFYHPPNADAARRLARSIFPAVQKQFPELKLFIVGENPPVDLKEIGSDHLIITGRVPDVKPYLDQAALLVAPVYLGGGMRIKVLESLAAGKAVVATPLAAEGLDVTDGEHLCLAKTDAEFVQRISYLLTHEQERVGLAERARRWASEHISWDQSMTKYEVLYRALLGESGQTKHDQTLPLKPKAIVRETD